MAESTHLDMVDVATIWRDRALLGDGGLFGGTDVWSLENLLVLQSLLSGEESDFLELEVLGQLLSGGESKVAFLLAEMFWLFYLTVPEHCISGTRKAEIIRRVYAWSGESLTPNHPLLRDLQVSIEGGPGLVFCANRHRELLFLINAVIGLKKHEERERRAILGNAGLFARKLDLVAERDVPQLNHIVRYLLFPDTYEPIFTSRDKRRIVESFSGIPRSETLRWSATKLDDELSVIRGQLQPLYGDQTFSFLHAPLTDSWRRVEQPVDAPAAEQRFWVERLPVSGRSGGENESLRVGNALWTPVRQDGEVNVAGYMRDVEPGDVVFHLTDNLGIVGVSVVEGMLDEEFRCPADAPGSRESGYRIPLQNFVEVSPVLTQTALLRESDYLEELRNLADQYASLFFNRQLTLNQDCYLSPAPEKLVCILDDLYHAENSRHLPHVHLPDGEDRASASSPRSGSTGNFPRATLLHGPCATGKTWMAMARAVEICDGNAPADPGQLLQRYRQLTDLGQVNMVTFHPAFGYAEFVEGIYRGMMQDPDGGAVQSAMGVRPGILRNMAQRAGSRVQKEGPGVEDLRGTTLWKMGTFDQPVQSFKDQLDAGLIVLPGVGQEDFRDCTSREKIKAQMESSDADVLTDKELVSALDLLVNQMALNDLVLLTNAEDSYYGVGRIVGEYAASADLEDRVFHQTRRVDWLVCFDEPQDWHQISRKKFKPRSVYRLDQSLLRMDDLHALLDSRREQVSNHVLIIDEIGRGDLNEVFGELITLISADPAVMCPPNVFLPLSGQQFSLPENLFIVGTLNSSEDTSLLNRQLLHRRFAFEELLPDVSLIRGDDEQGTIADGEGARLDLRRLLQTLNTRIEVLAGREYCLGHGLFMHVRSFTDLLQVVRARIVPQLVHLFNNDWKLVQRVFRDVLDDERPNVPQIIAHQQVDGANLFDSAGQFAEKAIRYRVSDEREMSPHAFRKIYDA